MNARNSFHSGIGARTIKCSVGYNHYGCREAAMNKDICSDRCPECGQREDWEYIILYCKISRIKEEYIHELHSKLKSNMHTAEEYNIIDMIMINIEAYLKQ